MLPVFDTQKQGATFSAITRAFELFRRPGDFRKLVQRCMRQDFSWRPSAQEYDRLYHQMTDPT